MRSWVKHGRTKAFVTCYYGAIDLLIGQKLFAFPLCCRNNSKMSHTNIQKKKKKKTSIAAGQAAFNVRYLSSSAITMVTTRSSLRNPLLVCCACSFSFWGVGKRVPSRRTTKRSSSTEGSDDRHSRQGVETSTKKRERFVCKKNSHQGGMIGCTSLFR